MVDGREESKQAQGAEQPQDDIVLQMMSTLEMFKSQMSSVKGGNIAARSKQRFHDVNKLEADIMLECLIIQEKILAVRTTLQQNVNSPTNINGCLLGSIDKYLVSFDAQIATLKAKFEVDRDYWNKQVQTAAKFEEIQGAQMMKCYKKFEMEISGYLAPGCLAPSAYTIKGLKDLENFGDKLKPTEETFRWPTVADLEKLNLTGPLQLKQIKTSGQSGYLITAIQLVFEHGIESPLFGVKIPNSGPISLFEVSDKPITTITAKSGGSAVYKLEVEQEGSNNLVCDVVRNSGSQYTRQVPANHSIVGVYGGRVAGMHHLDRLGFIVMEN